MNKWLFWIYLISLVLLIIISAIVEAPLGICGYLIAGILIIQGRFPKFGGRYKFLLKHIGVKTWKKAHLIISLCLTILGTIGLLIKFIF